MRIPTQCFLLIVLCKHPRSSSTASRLTGYLAERMYLERLLDLYFMQCLVLWFDAMPRNVPRPVNCVVWQDLITAVGLMLAHRYSGPNTNNRDQDDRVSLLHSRSTNGPCGAVLATFQNPNTWLTCTAPPLATSLDVCAVLSLRHKYECRSVCGDAVSEMTTERCPSSTLAVSRRHSAASRECTAAVNSIPAGTIYYDRLVAPQNC